MRLIGAGLPRTATLSQKVGLEMLGVGPCYHMVDVLSDLDRVQLWTNAIEGRADWAKIFNGYEATVDWPGAFFYRELMDEFPDAKVLLSVRSGESWARSMLNTIYGVFFGDSLMYHLSSARRLVDPGWNSYIEFMLEMWSKAGLVVDGEMLDANQLAQAMERYNAEVQRTVPADRLLVWTAADGWEPLCRFLEVPAPQVPFPNVNDSETFADRIVEAALDTLVSWRDERASSTSE